MNTLPPDTLDFGFVAATAAALAAWLLTCRRRGASAWLALAPALLMGAGALGSVALRAGIDVDESEHLYVSHLLGQGLLPYREVWQPHAPLLWLAIAPLLQLAIAPLLQLLPETPYVLFVFRGAALVAFGLSLGLACGLARDLTGRGDSHSAWVTPLCTVLALAPAVPAEVYQLRPDTFMAPLALASLACLLRLRRGPLGYALLAGAALALAVSLRPKVAQLALAAPLAVWRSVPSLSGRAAGDSGLRPGVGARGRTGARVARLPRARRRRLAGRHRRCDGQPGLPARGRGGRGRNAHTRGHRPLPAARTPALADRLGARQGADARGR